MTKIRYYYDTETCRYERIQTTKPDLVMNFFGILFAILIIGVSAIYIYITHFPSPKENTLRKENEDLLTSYKLVDKELSKVKKMLTALQERDDNIYRVIYEAEPIPKEIRNAGTGGTQKYKALLNKKLAREDLIISTLNKIEKLKRQMYIQTKSYDEIVNLARNKYDLLASIPAIQPISNKDLKKFASGYGMRFHPILKVKRMHQGCDFSAKKGTPIYATGDGKVVMSRRNRGYGHFIKIDHGFGYKTHYAHLSRYAVRNRQKVKRGDLIGYVGSTGLSVAPHLHYEVVYNGRKVNPINHFYNDLTPDQYNKLLEMAALENQSLE